MYRFFADIASNVQDEIIITGDDVNHIKNVLRLNEGEHITISDGCNREYVCLISSLEEDRVVTKIEDVLGTNAELDTEIILFQGYPKSDKMELIIQKVTELGVSKIVPVMTKRTVVKLDDKKAAKKIERFNSIALAAAKQSKRGIIPEVMPVMSYKKALEYASTLDMNIVPYEDAEGIEHSRKVIDSIKGKKTLGIFIGPEGGFASEEIEMAMDIGAIPITLGHRILRTETAGLAVMSIIMFNIEKD